MDTGEKREDQGQGQSQRIKRVALPSGKTIEVVYYEDGPIDQAPATDRHDERHDQRQADREELHLCSECDSRLVYPVHWTEVDRASWEVTLRCPNCEWSHTGVYDQETVERFDDELDRGTDNLVDDLKRLIHANMEDEIERFTHALARDYILPEDF
jgi:hypothetical protein